MKSLVAIAALLLLNSSAVAAPSFSPAAPQGWLLVNSKNVLTLQDEFLIGIANAQNVNYNAARNQLISAGYSVTVTRQNNPRGIYPKGGYSLKLLANYTGVGDPTLSAVDVRNAFVGIPISLFVRP